MLIYIEAIIFSTVTKFVPIDFSRCGYGFYLYDIGEALGDMAASMRQHFFEGYAQVKQVPTASTRLIETFFNASTIENYAFLAANPAEHEWLAKAVPFVVRKHMIPFLSGDSFLFQN